MKSFQGCRTASHSDSSFGLTGQNFSSEKQWRESWKNSSVHSEMRNNAERRKVVKSTSNNNNSEQEVRLPPKGKKSRIQNVQGPQRPIKFSRTTAFCKMGWEELWEGVGEDWYTGVHVHKGATRVLTITMLVSGDDWLLYTAWRTKI